MTRHPPRIAARALILDRDRLLLVNAYPGGTSDLWCAPGGGVEAGQSLPDNLAREVHEETGHAVTAKEFVGTLCYEVNGRSKIVQFWRMHPNGGPARELMNDIKQVAWLPLEKAIRKLARPHEKAFLASAGCFE